MKRKSFADAMNITPQPAADGATPPADTSRARRVIPIALAEIHASDRRRPVDPEQVQVIAESVGEIGLQSPIAVRLDPADAAGYRLVAGAHRIAAAAELGWTRIDALVVDGSDDELALMEIDENLARAELTPLDRALFLAERKAIYLRLHPGAGKPGRPRQSANCAKFAQFQPRSFEEDAERQVGLSRRGVYRALEIGTGLVPTLAEALRDTPLSRREGDLFRLARMPAADQEAAAERIRAGDEVKPAKLGDVVKTSPRERQAKTARDDLVEAWNRARPEERRWFLEWLRERNQRGGPRSPEGRER